VRGPRSIDNGMAHRAVTSLRPSRQPDRQVGQLKQGFQVVGRTEQLLIGLI
jgi:hypothetical protein